MGQTVAMVCHSAGLAAVVVGGPAILPGPRDGWRTGHDRRVKHTRSPVSQSGQDGCAAWSPAVSSVRRRGAPSASSTSGSTTRSRGEPWRPVAYRAPRRGTARPVGARRGGTSSAAREWTGGCRSSPPARKSLRYHDVLAELLAAPLLPHVLARLPGTESGIIRRSLTPGPENRYQLRSTSQPRIRSTSQPGSARPADPEAARPANPEAARPANPGTRSTSRPRSRERGGEVAEQPGAPRGSRGPPPHPRLERVDHPQRVGRLPDVRTGMSACSTSRAMASRLATVGLGDGPAVERDGGAARLLRDPARV